MKLSEMLRYMLYECNDERVPLEKEIIYINNYIGLQQLKTEQQQNISTDFGRLDHIISMVINNVVYTLNGVQRPIQADTYCIHGDTAAALQILMYLSDELPKQHIFLKK
jgi:lactam utilization protein B